jgi:NAD(P)H dehydrogenase (quinone)
MPDPVKLAIIYYSSTGTVDAMARHAARVGEKAGAEVRLRHVVWADAVVFGTPTRFGNVASQLKQFIDTLGPQWGEGLLADKTYAAFTAAKTAHGGHESTLLALYNTIHHFGGIVVPPGYTDEIKFEEGNPYGVSQVDQGSEEPLDDTASEALTHLVERLVSITGKLNA